MVTWDSETHGVGIAEIDLQHRRLVEIINQIDAALDAGADAATLRELLDVLIQFTEFHFFTEEHYMRRHGFPDEATHREGHHHLVDQLLALRAEFANTAKNATRSTIGFLGDWLLDHIVNTDKELGAFLQVQGVR